MRPDTPSNETTGPPARWAAATAAAAGVLALLSASCCVLPLALAIVGLGGSWLVVLAPFVAYRGVVLAVVAVVLALAWVIAIRRRQRQARAVTAVATVMFGAAMSAPLWEGAAVRGLWSVWSGGG